MKKILFLALAASVFLMPSCVKNEAPYRSGEVDFTVRASLPKDIHTYTSEKGGVSNVDETAYDLRYILEVRTKDAPYTLIYREVQTTNDFTEPMEFTTRLLAAEYNFVLWADFVTTGGDADLFYNAADLLDIKMSGTYELSNEARDAYYACAPIDLTSGGASANITLTRPFGKIRLVATDALTGSQAAPVTAGITYNPTTFPAGFNALQGVVTSQTVDVSAELLSTLVMEDVTVGTEAYDDAYVVAFDYIFASSAMESVEITLACYDASNAEVSTKEISAIPVAKNKLTTVIGDLFSVSGVVRVIVDEEFDEEIVQSEVSTLAGIQAALDGGASTVTMTEEIAADGTIIIPAGAPDEITIDLSGGIADGTTLTINVADSNYSGTINVIAPTGSEGNLTVIAPNATVNLDGDFGNLDITSGPDTLVISANSTINNLKINGGNAIIYGQVNNFTSVAAGSKVYWGAGTEERLRTVLRKDGTYNHGIILTANIASSTLDENSGAILNQDGFYIGYDKAALPANLEYYDATPYDGYLFDGNGFTLSGQAFNNVMAVYAHNVTIKNLNVMQESGMRPNGGISVYRSTGLTLDNVTITNCGKEAGLIINASTVTATNLTTSGNYFGGVIVTKGSAPLGGNQPSFTFDETCTFGEDVPLYVRTERTGTDYAVVAPEGWNAVAGNVTPTQGGTVEQGIIYVEGPVTLTFSSEYFDTFKATRDRYLPAAIDFIGDYEGVSNVFKYTVNQSSNITNRPSGYNSTFYNTQGAQWFVGNATGNTKWVASVKIYVSQAMIDNTASPFRVELWSTTVPENYPLLGVSNVDGNNATTGNGPVWKTWNTDATTSEDAWQVVPDVAVTAGWHTIAIVSDGTTVDYYIDGVDIGDAGSNAAGSHCICLMPETYNFGEMNGIPTTYSFEAYFGEMTFELK